MQLRHFIQSLQCAVVVSRPLTPFERLCSASNPQQHVISAVHSILWENKPADEGKACKAWAKDLQLNPNKEQ